MVKIIKINDKKGDADKKYKADLRRKILSMLRFDVVESIVFELYKDYIWEHADGNYVKANDMMMKHLAAWGTNMKGLYKENYKFDTDVVNSTMDEYIEVLYQQMRFNPDDGNKIITIKGN